MIPSVQSGIILRKTPYGEADAIVTALLSGGGVRRFFAAGVRKSRRRYVGLVDHFSCLNLNYLPRAEGLWRLVSVDEIRDTAPIWQEPRAFALGHLLAELICVFTPEEVPSADIFDLWGRVEKVLQGRPVDAALACWILLRFLPLFGYAIDLTRCRQCGEGGWGRSTGFRRESGGLLCAACVQAGSGRLSDLADDRRKMLLAEEIPANAGLGAMAVFLGEVIGFCELHAQRTLRAGVFLQELLQSE